MANKIKETGEGYGLQVTREARAAGLAEEKDADGLEGAEKWTDLSEVWVYGFKSVFLVVDQEIDERQRAELVATAARDEGAIFEGHQASIWISGDGCAVSLPGIAQTPFRVGDRTPVSTAPGMLVITDGSRDADRLASDLVAIRRDQVA